MPTDGVPERVKRMYSGRPRGDSAVEMKQTEPRPLGLTAEGIPRRAKVAGDT